MQICDFAFKWKPILQAQPHGFRHVRNLRLAKDFEMQESSQARLGKQMFSSFKWGARSSDFVKYYHFCVNRNWGPKFGFWEGRFFVKILYLKVLILNIFG